VRGRFAPSPTGPLHFGSLVAAVGSFLEARAKGGEWLVRMEDVDVPRTVPGAADRILDALERAGLHWDGPVMWQSERGEAYAEALGRLHGAGHVYPCGCSRKDLAGRAYPGTCRAGVPAGRAARSVRVRTSDGEIAFADAVQGRFGERIERAHGDFLVRRADDTWAYHLAVVVDDAAQGVTEIVRGSDLLDSTPRQIHLQRLLGLPTPRYAHLPVAVNRQGQKLSKQTHAAPLPDGDLRAAIAGALRFLGHELPGDVRDAPAPEMLAWATPAWSLRRVPRQRPFPFDRIVAEHHRDAGR